MIEMGKYVSADVKGCGNIESSIHKTDCYFYFEQADMGSHIPCCSFAEYGLGECPCADCTNYMPQSKVSEIVRAFIKSKANKPTYDERQKALINLHFDSMNCENKEKRKQYNTAIKLLESIPFAESYEGMTNGEVLEAVFPNIDFGIQEFDGSMWVAMEDIAAFTLDWWNSPYEPQESEDKE